jgi:hypothetical protein
MTPKSLMIERPLYEDTFDIIDDFLCECLFDEWKNFVQTENTYFNQVRRKSILIFLPRPSDLDGLQYKKQFFFIIID